MGVRIQRFDFGSLRDFRSPMPVTVMPEEIEEEIPPAPPPPTFSEEEMEVARMAAKKLGYAEGFEAGAQQARREIDAQTQEINALLLQLGENLQGLSMGYERLLVKESAELGSLVLAIAKKVAGDAMNERGMATISALVERCIPVVMGKPRLMIDLHPDVLEAAMIRIESVLRSHGVECEIQFRGNPNLQRHDVVLDWGSGQASQSAAAIWQEIETLLERVPLELAFEDNIRNP